MQGPVLLTAAEQLGVDPEVAIMALSYGDQITNLIQPFWALPLLAIARLRIRDILDNYAFVRTTEQRHHAASIALWKAMEANGDLCLDRHNSDLPASGRSNPWRSWNGRQR